MFLAGRILQSKPLLSFLLVLLSLLLPIQAQQPALPKEIRGYKVHRAKVQILAAPTAAKTDDVDARIKFGEPRLLDASLSGISFDVSVEASALTSTGTIDLLTFRDFHVNGVPVEIEEYSGPVLFKKGDSFHLPRPVKLFVSSGGILQAAWNEFRNAQNEWLVTGQVFVFGRFHKMGLTFKRVVPVEIQIKIKNPLPRVK